MLTFGAHQIHLFGGDPNQVTVWGQSAGTLCFCLPLLQLSKLRDHKALVPYYNTSSLMAETLSHLSSTGQ